MKFLLGEADKGQVAWEEGEWFFVDTRRWQGQVPQLPPDAPAFELETVLRKADIDKLIAYVTKHCIEPLGRSHRQRSPILCRPSF